MLPMDSTNEGVLYFLTIFLSVGGNTNADMGSLHVNIPYAVK